MQGGPGAPSHGHYAAAECGVHQQTRNPNPESGDDPGRYLNTKIAKNAKQ